MQHKDTYSGILFLVIAQIMVGLNIVVSKFLLVSVPMVWLLEIRFALAALSLLPLHWLTPAKKITVLSHFSPLQKKDWLFILAQALTAGILFNCLILTGLHYTDANAAGIITSVLPAIIAVMSWLILKESFSMQTILCIFFATAGLFVIAFDKFTGLNASHSVWGDVIVLISLLPEATYYILCKLHPNRLPIFLIASLINAINALLLLPALFFIEWHPVGFSIQNMGILFIIGLTSGLFYIFWFLGAKKVDGMMASLSTATMPIATVIFAYLILGEWVTRLQCLGMGLVILSIVIYAKR